MRQLMVLAVLAGCGVMLAGPAGADNLVPQFLLFPTGWGVDRYAPDSFSNVGTYQGIDNVLGIGIGPNGNLANRPSGQQSTFYNTQGEGYNVSGGAGSYIEAQLYVPGAWSSDTNVTVRTDLWGVIATGGNVPDYPIIGFTNDETGSGTFRVWDDTNGHWIDLSNTVNYDQWNSLGIVFTGSSYEFFVNDSLALTETSVGGATGFQEVILEAYNFNDPSLITGTPSLKLQPGALTGSYIADWANAPEPASLAVLGMGLAGLGLVRRRKRV